MSFFKHLWNSKKNDSSTLPHLTGFGSSKKDDLLECTIENTASFSFKSSGKVLCKVLHVHDGDTIDIAMKFMEQIRCFRVRLNGVDAPELHPVLNRENREEIIEKAKKAKDFLTKSILNKVLPIEIKGQDKYGRLLGELYVDEHTIVTYNQIMIQSGNAVEYSGKTKRN